jgi:tetratricopeptide (TPR) repeat protein
MNDPRRAWHIVFGLACVMVIGIFAWSAEPGFHGVATPRPEDCYYNLLVQGFRAGQLNVKRDAPPALASVSNPYDPAVNKQYIWDSHDLCHDMSFYKGKLYLYFGVVPALTLYWPYVVLTGHYLPDKGAVVIFFALGFLISAGLLHSIWRRYFPHVGVWVMAAGVMATGLATGIWEILPSCDVYETAMSGGFAFAMLALAGIWKALHEPNRKMRWQLLASLAYGLAIGSRPSLFFGAIILLVPVAQAWFDPNEQGCRRRAGLLLVPTVIPIALVGLGLMLYNYLRFQNPFEFGWHYLLADMRNVPTRQFGLGYFWFNAHFYFLGPMRWTSHFPFLAVAQLPPLPPGHGGVETPYSGILTLDPIACFALAAPLAWRTARGKNVPLLQWFVTALLALFLTCALTICLFFAACNRYQIDFVPVLMLLAVIGIFGLEQTLQNSIAWRRAGRAAWCVLLAYSILFNALAAVKSFAMSRYLDGNVLLNQGRVDVAIDYFKRASGYDPQSATFHLALANALSLSGQVEESIFQYQDAMEIRPDDAEVANNLAYTLLRAGRVNDAIKYFQKASELQKTYQSYYNLAFALRMNKMALEAETNLQKAVDLQPQFMPAQIDLSWILATWPDATARNGARALAIAEDLNRQHPDDPKILRTLAAACAETGHFPEAVDTAKRALALAQTQSQTALAGQLQVETRLYQKNNPCRSFGH